MREIKKVKNQVMIGYRLKYNGISPVKDAIWRDLLDILLRTMLYIELE